MKLLKDNKYLLLKPDNSMSTEEYLRPKEVREILKISDKTIYNWEKAGKNLLY